MKRILALMLAVGLLWSAPAAALSAAEEEAALLEAGRAALAQCVSDDMTDVEKITALHDWLCLHTDYGLAPRAKTAYGALVNGSAVCTGYAEGLAFLAELAGLDAAVTYSEAVDHAWILVTLDGARYFCDSTWDDGKNAKLGLIRHQYMLFDEQNAGETNRYGWDSPEAVPGGPLENIPWAAAVTRVIFSGEYAYYISGDFALIRCNRATWETDTLLKLEETWARPEDETEAELYTGLVLRGERLYFNTPRAVCSVTTQGTGLRLECAPETDGGQLYGLDVREGKLCYSLAAAPDAVTYEIADTGVFCWGAWGYAWDPADLWEALRAGIKS